MTAVATREDFSCPDPDNRSAYRTVTIPMLRISAGPGPSVGLMAGVHGDEWEGQAALLALWHELPRLLHKGTVYVVPSANVQASLAGTRLSPSDAGNLNRAFLGAPARGYTETLAAALESRLLARIQYLIDVHSGGTSLRYLPSCVVTRHGDDAFDACTAKLARDFGMPHCLFFRSNEPGSLPAAASRRKVARISAEIGGAGETSRELVQACRQAMLSCLAGLGMIDAGYASNGDSPALYDLSPAAATVRADRDGVLVPEVALGSRVDAGQRLAALIEPARPDRPADPVPSPQAGTVLCLRPIARSRPGDCLFQVAPPLPFDTLPRLYDVSCA